jgi:hypothetical protein
MSADASSDTPRLIDNVRGIRYGEVIAVFARDNHFEAEVFGTQFLNDCPQELWEGLNPTTIAIDLGALHVKLNGPRHWVIDGIGQKVNTLEPVLRDFGGLLSAVEAVPTWKGIIEQAEGHHAGVIVIGSHRREGFVGHLGGSVASAVVSHATCPVFLVRKQP